MKTAYDYQVTGVKWLRQQRRGYLADEAGLGKTLQALLAASLIGRLADVLIVGPAMSLDNWYEAAEEIVEDLHCMPTIISYEGAVRGQGQGKKWHMVILDEAHYAKNLSAQRSIAAYNLARGAERAYLLSATPMPRDVRDLYAPLKALWPELLTRRGILTQQHWLDMYARYSITKYGPRVFGTKNEQDLNLILNTIMLRRTLKDVSLQLPPLRVHVSLLPYDETVEKATWEYEGADLRYLREITKDSEERSTSRLRRLLGELKVTTIANVLYDELERREYEKIVVFAYHTRVIEYLRQALQPFEVVMFTGDTTPYNRSAAVNRFQNGSARVFLGQMTAAGTSLNLQAASEVVLVELSFVPDENYQPIKRIHRIGQDRPCRARIFAVAGTMDEPIMRTAANRLRDAASLGLGV